MLLKLNLVQYLCCLSLLVAGMVGCAKPGTPQVSQQQLQTNSDQFLNAALQRLESGLHLTPDSTKIPRALEHDGAIRGVPSSDWTSGFFPGNLWFAYSYTNDARYREQAAKWTAFIEKEKYNNRTHDMGFKVNCSFGNGYALTRNPHYKDVLVKSAQTLITRYNPKVGAIRSWDFGKDKWQYPVIIDNMLNLELLFLATKLTGDSTYYKIAKQHALTTLKNHFRNDFSTYHVINYDTLTGKVISKETHQGIAHESSWARGQGWAIYGYSMLYRETGDKRFLQQAEKVAGFILNHKNLPSDMVPYFDFDAPDIPNAPRDASAAAVIASALYELSTFSTGNSKLYRTSADKIVHSLAANYMAPVTDEHPFILLHSTGNYPKNDEIDAPIIYSDYYYLEALLRRKAIDSKI